MTGTDDANVHFQQGLGFLARHEPARAARAFRAAIAVDEKHVEAHHGLVRALREAGRLEQAIGAALALTVLTPADPKAHRTLADSLGQAGHNREAEIAAAHARIVEWRLQLQSAPATDASQ